MNAQEGGPAEDRDLRWAPTGPQGASLIEYVFVCRLCYVGALVFVMWGLLYLLCAGLRFCFLCGGFSLCYV